MPSEQYFCKLGGRAAILGVLVLFTATLLHPLGAHPEDAPAAFTEYAADQYWVAIHLGQLFGVVLITAGLDDALQEGERLLCRIADRLLGL